MPKVAVVCYGTDGPATGLADAAVEGLRSVRFMEVDRFAGVDHEGPPPDHARVLQDPESLREYDGVLFACGGTGDAGVLPPDLLALLERLERVVPDRAFRNTLFAATGTEHPALLDRLDRLGGIIVSAPRGLSDPEARAKALGARLAKVVGWIRHALSHEHHHH